MKELKHTNPDGSVVTIYVGEGAVIGEGAIIGAWTRIGQQAVIGEWTRIGQQAVIGEWAVIGAWARIGQQAIIGAWARIGAAARIGEWAVIGERAKRHAVRSDGHVFTVGTLDGVPTVWAGCREFNESRARKHWGNPAHPHRDETRAILDFLFR